MSACPPLWQRALMGRARDKVERENRGASARMALVQELRKAGQDVSLTRVHTWSRARQGQAYLWARARQLGREDLPAPEWM